MRAEDSLDSGGLSLSLCWGTLWEQVCVFPAIINKTHRKWGSSQRVPRALFLPNLFPSHTAYEVMAFPDPFKRLVFTVSDLSPNYQLWLWSCVLSFLRDTHPLLSPPLPPFCAAPQLPQQHLPSRVCIPCPPRTKKWRCLIVLFFSTQLLCKRKCEDVDKELTMCTSSIMGRSDLSTWYQAVCVASSAKFSRCIIRFEGKNAAAETVQIPPGGIWKGLKQVTCHPSSHRSVFNSWLIVECWLCGQWGAQK